MQGGRLAKLLLVGCVGCGASGPFDYVPVSGTIAYEDGSAIPAEGLRLRFYAVDAGQIEGASPRPATAHVDASGGFSQATSYKYGDGLVPGRHRVAVLNAVGPSGRTLIPEEYTHGHTTPCVVDTNKLPFDIRVPKP